MHLELRDVAFDDLPILFEHQRDPDAVALAAVRSRTWPEFEQHWRERVLADPRVRMRAIVVEGTLVGYVSAWQREHERMVAYWIDRAWWGRKLASRALALFLRDEPLRPLHAEVAAHNLGSMRVLDKCGFVRTGSHAGDDGIVEQLFRLD